MKENFLNGSIPIGQISLNFVRNTGKEFENEFHRLCLMQQIVCIRIPDGSKVVKNKFNKYSILKIKSPFDFLITQDGKTCAIDCKSTNKKSFSHSMVNQNQIEQLLYCSKSITAGYLVKFEHIEKGYVFFSADLLYKLNKGESLSIQKDGIFVNKNELDLLLRIKEFSEQGIFDFD